MQMKKKIANYPDTILLDEFYKTSIFISTGHGRSSEVALECFITAVSADDLSMGSSDILRWS